MRPVVFAGPSLGPGDRERFPVIEFRPPARKGDLLIAAADGARTIGVVDGLFETAPSVWHKEILHCLASGITVAGAASMGALRAAECARYGMIGVGRIFEEYHAGQRVADADVAVLHAPAALAYAPLNVATVDVELTVARLVEAGLLAKEAADKTIAVSRAIHFKFRTWPEIISQLKEKSLPGDLLERNLSEFRVDQKREDCLALLEFVAGTPPGPDPQLRFELQNTAFLATLLQQTAKR